MIFSIPVLACNIGTYGEGCKEECGHCHNTTSCNHVNGSCLNECKPGYTGSQCKTSKLRVWNQSRKGMLTLYSNICQDPINCCLSRPHWLNKKKKWSPLSVDAKHFDRLFLYILFENISPIRVLQRHPNV